MSEILRSINPTMANLLLPAAPAAVRPLRQRREPAPYVDEEEERTLAGSLRDKSLTTIGAVGNLLDLPGSMVRDVGSSIAQGKFVNPFDQLLSPFSADNRTTGKELLRQTGIVDDADTWGNAIAGFGAEVAMDPLTYMTFGGSALGKSGQLASKAGLLDELGSVAARKAGKQIGQVGSREARLTTTLADVAQYGTERSAAKAKQILKDSPDLADEAFGGLAGFGLPFMQPMAIAGQGAKSQAVARGLDTAGRTVRYGKIPGTEFQPVNSLLNLFDAPAMGTKSPMWQAIARHKSRQKDVKSADVLMDTNRWATELEQAGLVGQDAADMLRDGLEGVVPIDSLPDAMQPIARQMRAQSAEMPARGRVDGVQITELTDDEIDYAARFLVATRGIHGKRSKAVFTADDPSNQGRKDFMRNVPGGTNKLKRELFLDDAINAAVDNGSDVDTIRKMMEAKANGWLPDTFKEFNPKAEGAVDGWVVKEGRYQKIAEWFGGLSKETREAGVFGNHPILDHTARRMAFEDSINATETVAMALSQPKILLPPSAAANAAADGSMTVGEVLAKLKMDLGDVNGGLGRKIMKSKGMAPDDDSIKVLRDMRLSKENAEELMSIHRTISGPDAINDLIGMMDSVVNYSKGMWTSVWPAFHVRNRISGAFQNMALGIWSKEGDTWADQLLKGKVIKGAAKEPWVRAVWEREQAELARINALTPPGGAAPGPGQPPVPGQTPPVTPPGPGAGGATSGSNPMLMDDGLSATPIDRTPPPVAGDVTASGEDLPSTGVVSDPGRQQRNYNSLKTAYPDSDAEISPQGRIFSPTVRNLLQRKQAGEAISQETIDAAVNKNLPWEKSIPIPSKESLPNIDTIKDAVGPAKAPFVGTASAIPAGQKITVRQDVPSMTNKGVGVVTVQSNLGKHYESILRFDNPDMRPKKGAENSALKIGAGGDKGPTIAITGKMGADQSIPVNLDQWTQVGFNPDRHSYYYDRQTGAPVTGGDEAIQIGNTVFVRNAQRADDYEPLYMARGEGAASASAKTGGVTTAANPADVWHPATFAARSKQHERFNSTLERLSTEGVLEPQDADILRLAFSGASEDGMRIMNMPHIKGVDSIKGGQAAGQWRWQVNDKTGLMEFDIDIARNLPATQSSVGVLLHELGHMAQQVLKNQTDIYGGEMGQLISRVQKSGRLDQNLKSLHGDKLGEYLARTYDEQFPQLFADSIMRRKVPQGAVGKIMKDIRNWVVQFLEKLKLAKPLPAPTQKRIDEIIDELLGFDGTKAKATAGPLRGNKGTSGAANVVAGTPPGQAAPPVPPTGAPGPPAPSGPPVLTDEEATRIIGRMAASQGVVGKFEGNATSIIGQPTGQSGDLMDTLSGIPRPGNQQISAGRVARKAVGMEPGTSLNPIDVRGVGGREESGFGIAAAGEEIGNYIEGMNRLGPWITMMKRGYDPAEASKKAGAAQVLYGNKNYTPFEQQVMARLFPFYKFSRGSMPVVARNLMEKPGGMYGTIIKGNNRAQGDGELAPDYVRDTANIPVDRNNPILSAIAGTPPEGTDRYITGFGLMHEDLMGFGPSVRGAGLEALSRMNPFIKGPLEWSTGQTFFQRGPEGGRDLDKLDPTIGRLVANVMGQTEPDDSKKFPLWMEQIVANSPIARATTTARSLTDPRKRSETVPGMPGAASLLNTLTGFRVSDVSPASKDAILREMLNSEMQDAGASVFERVYFSKEELDKMSPAARENAIKLQGLANVLAQRSKERKAQRQAEEAKKGK